MKKFEVVGERTDEATKDTKEDKDALPGERVRVI